MGHYGVASLLVIIPQCIICKAKENDPQQDQEQQTPVATPLRKRCATDGPVQNLDTANTLPDAKKLKPTPGSPTVVPVDASASPTQQPQPREAIHGKSGNGDVGEKPPNNPKPKFIAGGLTRRQAWGLSQYMF